MTATRKAATRWQLHLPVVAHPCGCRWLTTIPPLPVPVRRVVACWTHSTRKWQR